MTATVLRRDEQDLLKIVSAIQELTQGRSNATGSFTITASATSTVVAAPNCAAGSVVLISPRTANAAAALATTYMAASNGSFTVTHANNAQTDRTFGFVCLG